MSGLLSHLDNLRDDNSREKDKNTHTIEESVSVSNRSEVEFEEHSVVSKKRERGSYRPQHDYYGGNFGMTEAKKYRGSTDGRYNR